MSREDSPVCSSVSAPPFAGAAKIRHWRETSCGDHFVQIYRTEEYLIDCLAGFFAEGLWNAESVVLIATSETRGSLDSRLRAKGLNMNAAGLQRRFFSYDAAELLSRISEGGRVRRDAFFHVVGDLLATAATAGSAVRVFAEPAALLALEGRFAAALELENLWHEISGRQPLRLFCAYPAHCLEAGVDGRWTEHICRAHSRVISWSA